MRLVKGFITVFLALVVGSATAHAGANNKASLLLHVGPHVSKNFCSTAPASCQGINTSGAVGNFYDVLVCVSNFSDSVSIGGVEFGIAYNPALSQGIDVFSWTRCGDLEFASDGWPQAGSGNLVTWVETGCAHTGQPFKVAGRFYIGVYSPDRLALTVRPASGRVKVASCAAEEDDLTNNAQSPLGFADFGTGLGYNPCLNVVPTSPMTWTGIKTLFREP